VLFDRNGDVRRPFAILLLALVTLSALSVSIAIAEEMSFGIPEAGQSVEVLVEESSGGSNDGSDDDELFTPLAEVVVLGDPKPTCSELCSSEGYSDDDCVTGKPECDALGGTAFSGGGHTSDCIGQCCCYNAPPECTSNANCDDGNACTDDTCVDNDCVYTPDDTNSCDDGLFCTVGDACSAGSCGGTARVCNDADECTVDSCNEGTAQCDYTPLDTPECVMTCSAYCVAIVGTTDGACITGSACSDLGGESPGGSINGQCSPGGVCCCYDACVPTDTVDTTCDGVDDDCDGTADEDYVPDTSCFLPGACSSGDQESTCVGGVETACQTGTPGTETCNGLDDDCDGVVDNGVCVCGNDVLESKDGYSEECDDNNTVSGDGCSENCEEEIGCTVGSTRPCYTGPNGTEGVGICKAGLETCVEDGFSIRSVIGVWNDTCVGEVLPLAGEMGALCTDGLDNDCDGGADLMDTTCTDLTVKIYMTAAATVGNAVVIIDEICNAGVTAVEDVPVAVLVDDVLFSLKDVTIPGNSCVNVSETWTAVLGTHTISKVVDPTPADLGPAGAIIGKVAEFDEDNNGASATIVVSAAPVEEEDGGREEGGGAIRGYIFGGAPAIELPQPEIVTQPAPEQPPEEILESVVEETPAAAPLIETPTGAVAAGEPPWWLVLLALVGGLILFLLWKRGKKYVLSKDAYTSLKAGNRMSKFQEFAKGEKVVYLGVVPQELVEVVKTASLKEKDKAEARKLAKDKGILLEDAEFIILAKLTDSVLITDSRVVQGVCKELEIEFVPLAEVLK